MRPGRRSQGATWSFTRTVSVPVMRLLTGRRGDSCCQCSTSGASWGSVPESSMTVVLASAGTATTSTVNSSSRGRGRMERVGMPSRRGQRVEHAAGIGARGGKGGVAVGEGPAALGPLVLGNGPHRLQRARGEASGGEGFTAAVAVAAGRPGNSREREGVAAGIDERGGHGRGHIDGAAAGGRGPIETADVQLRGDVTERKAVVGACAHGAVRGHGLRGAIANCGGGHGDRLLVNGRVIARRAAGVVVAGKATDSHLQIDGLGRHRGDGYREGANRVRN